MFRLTKLESSSIASHHITVVAVHLHFYIHIVMHIYFILLNCVTFLASSWFMSLVICSLALLFQRTSDLELLAFGLQAFCGFRAILSRGRDRQRYGAGLEADRPKLYCLSNILIWNCVRLHCNHCHGAVVVFMTMLLLCCFWLAVLGAPVSHKPLCTFAVGATAKVAIAVAAVSEPDWEDRLCCRVAKHLRAHRSSGGAGRGQVAACQAAWLCSRTRRCGRHGCPRRSWTQGNVRKAPWCEQCCNG